VLYNVLLSYSKPLQGPGDHPDPNHLYHHHCHHRHHNRSPVSICNNSFFSKVMAAVLHRLQCILPGEVATML